MAEHHKNIKVMPSGKFQVVVSGEYVGAYATIEQAIIERDKAANAKPAKRGRTTKKFTINGNQDI